MAKGQFRKSISKGLAGLLVGTSTILGNVENVRGDGSMRVYNVLNGYPSNISFVAVSYSSALGATDSVDANDSSRLLSPNQAYTFSRLEGINLSLKDERTNNPTNLPFKIRFVFNGTTPTASTNKAYFTFPTPTNNFPGKNITIQECDSNDVPFGPIYDVRNAITNNGGYLPTNWALPSGTYSTNSPYRQFLLEIKNPTIPTFNVTISNGDKYNLSQTNFTGVPSGSSVTTTAANIYWNDPTNFGKRTKITGLGQ